MTALEKHDINGEQVHSSFSMYIYFIQNHFPTLIETYLDEKVPWNFLHSFKEHLNSIYGSKEDK